LRDGALEYWKNEPAEKHPRLQTSKFKHQIASTKLQINLKQQYPRIKPFVISNFGNCDLFVIWDLIFGISNNPSLHYSGERMKHGQTPLWGEIKVTSSLRAGGWAWIL